MPQDCWGKGAIQRRGTTSEDRKSGAMAYQMQDNLAVRLRFRLQRRLQFFCEQLVIVDFTIDTQRNLSILANQGLFTGLYSHQKK